ncbi:hypothetical protein ACQ4PT_042053 [Festuca glaucescens]
MDTNVQDEAANFAAWVLSIGDGKVPAVARQGESEPTWITIPSEHLVHTDGDKITAIVDYVYVDFLRRYSDPNYLKERAILTPTNEIAEDVNEHVLSMVPGEEREYLSCDTTGNSADGIRNIDIFYPVEMAINPLREIHKDSHHWTICVLVSRMWHYRGGTDEGAIKHTDLVLLDIDGTHMYGQLPPSTAERLKDVLQEGKVFVIRKFFYNASRTSFRPVESPFMVQFTKYTTVEERPGMEVNYPFCTYSLTAFDELLDPSGRPARFVGVTGLSGSSACRWYIDEDIPDINSFRTGLGEQFTPLSAYVPTVSDALPTRFYVEPVEMTMKELNDVDPFVDMEKRFICSVTVDFITADQRWWFASCKLCHKSAKHDGYQFHCTGEACSSVKADLAYCVSFFASDATGGAEFVMFDRVGVAAVGKHLMTLMHQRYPGHSTVDEIVAVARHDTGIPAEISRLVNQKYKLLVSISKKWKTCNNVDEPLAFQVCRIIETYKPELPPLSFAPGLVSTALSSSAGGSGTRILPLGPVMSPGLHAPQANGSPHNQAFRGGYGSPVAQALVDDAAAAADGKEDNVVLSKGAAVGVKEDGVVLPKSKRGASANKPGGAIKKPKV